MPLQKCYIYLLLLVLAVGIGNFGKYHLPNGAFFGGEFLKYQNYLDFVVTNELQPLNKANMYQQGYWLWNHRILFLLNNVIPIGGNIAFEQAAYFNTKEIAPQQYANLAQRQAYYRWANQYFERHKYRIKWMKAADKTIGTLAFGLPKLVSWLGYSNAEIRAFILKGNKLILDDMLPRINDLMSNTSLEKQLTAEEALQWDAQTLADEQALIQPLYKVLSKESIRILENNLSTTYGVKINMLSIPERWTFGMHLMGYNGITPDRMPVPGGCWSQINMD